MIPTNADSTSSLPLYIKDNTAIMNMKPSSILEEMRTATPPPSLSGGDVLTVTPIVRFIEAQHTPSDDTNIDTSANSSSSSESESDAEEDEELDSDELDDELDEGTAVECPAMKDCPKPEYVISFKFDDLSFHTTILINDSLSSVLALQPPHHHHRKAKLLLPPNRKQLSQQTHRQILLLGSATRPSRKRKCTSSCFVTLRHHFLLCNHLLVLLALVVSYQRAASRLQVAGPDLDLDPDHMVQASRAVSYHEEVVAAFGFYYFPSYLIPC